MVFWDIRIQYMFLITTPILCLAIRPRLLQPKETWITHQILEFY